MKMLRETGGVGKVASWALLAVLVMGFSTAAEAAPISVALAPDDAVYEVGEVVTVDVLATTDEMLVGYGFDVLVDPASSLSYVGFEAGEGYTGVGTPDGDGIAGLSFDGGVSGTDILIGVATFLAERVGQVSLTPAVTPGDLTEGFARSGNGFLDLSASSAQISIVSSLNAIPGGGGGPVGGTSPTIPEPATMVLLAGGVVLFRRRK